jgi:GNAT superfamily N-acetyltransferase
MEAYRDHLMHLDPRSRHQRFGGGISDNFLVHYAKHCFCQGDLLFGAFVDGELVGAAELRSSSAIWSEQAPFGRHIHAEAAFSVREGSRRQGVGEKLFRRIQRAASNHGVETIVIVCLPNNVEMRMLAQKFKAQFTFEQDNLTGRLRAPPDPVLSHARGRGRRGRFRRRHIRRPTARRKRRPRRAGAQARRLRATERRPEAGRQRPSANHASDTALANT